MDILTLLGLPKMVRGLISGLLSLITILMPSSMFTSSEETSKYMLKGDESFSYEEGANWTLGFAQTVLTPDDVNSDTYYIAGYNTNNPATGVLDDMYAKAVYLDDNTGSGGVVLCAVDCVGISRADINDIRQLVIESGKLENVKSINICSTHTHSAVDTQGLWGKNFLSDGKNDEFMRSLKQKTAEAIIKAYEAREDGKLYYGTTEAKELLVDTREPVDFDATVTSVRFEPANGTRDTYVINFACHAEMLGSKTQVVSADFPAYMTKKINEQTGGANVMFVNGAIGGLISGEALEDILHTEGFDCLKYTIEFGEKLADKVLGITNEKELNAILNIKTQSVVVPCANTALILARFIGVLNNDMEKLSCTEVGIISEVSYMELGDRQVGIFMIPGELYPELASGNFLTAENSANSTAADYKPLYQMTDCEHSFVLGLCNDELGYIIPENDFFLHEWFQYFNIAYDKSGRKHYEETNSVGPAAAAALLDAMDSLIDSAK